MSSWPSPWLDCERGHTMRDGGRDRIIYGAVVSQTNLQIIQFAFQRTGIVDETQAPTAAQGQNGLQILNNYLLTQAKDGMRVGWYTQTNLAATAPLKDEDIHDVESLLCQQIANFYGVKINEQEHPGLLQEIQDATHRLTKRSILYFESDLSELSRPQGGPWGGPQWL